MSADKYRWPIRVWRSADEVGIEGVYTVGYSLEHGAVPERVVVDVSPIARRHGIEWPVGLDASLWNVVIDHEGSDLLALQRDSSRLMLVLALAQQAVERWPDDSATLLNWLVWLGDCCYDKVSVVAEFYDFRGVGNPALRLRLEGVRVFRLQLSKPAGSSRRQTALASSPPETASSSAPP